MGNPRPGSTLNRQTRRQEALSVGWKLAEEIAWARPERPGPEWWTLMDIAQDARDETRRGMPGAEYLIGRAKCSRATLYRRLKALTNAGLLVIASHAGPGKRTVYEIPVIHTEPLTCLTNVETRTGLTNVETRSRQVAPDVSQNGDQRVSLSGRMGLSVSETPSVIPSPTPPSTTGVAVITPSVEGSSATCGQPKLDLVISNGHKPAAEIAWPPIGRHSRQGGTP